MQTDKYGAEAIMTWWNEDRLAAIGSPRSRATREPQRDKAQAASAKKWYFWFTEMRWNAMLLRISGEQLRCCVQLISSPHNDHSCITPLSQSLANVAFRRANADIGARWAPRPADYLAWFIAEQTKTEVSEPQWAVHRPRLAREPTNWRRTGHQKGWTNPVM
jgi:hypothetical protein